MKKFDMNWILTFNAIYEEKSLTKASERLGMSEKNAGLILKKLREYFLDQLVIRSHSGFIATPLSTDLYANFSQLALLFQQTLNKLEPEVGVDSGNRRIILSMSSPLEFLFNHIYSSEIDRLSGYAFSFNAVQSYEDEINSLRHGLTDIYLSLNASDDSFIHNEMLISSPLSICLVLNKKHPRYRHIVEEGLFNNEKFISCGYNEIIENYFFDKLNIPREILFRRDSIFDLLGILANEDMILICPGYYQLLINNDDRFTAVRVVTPDIVSATIYSSYAKNNRKSSDIKFINKIIKEEMVKIALEIERMNESCIAIYLE